MIDTALVRGLIRFFAGTVVLDHNASFLIWRKSTSIDDTLVRSLRRDQEFLRQSASNLLNACQEIGFSLPEDFFGLSELSSIAVGSDIDSDALCCRFRNDHLQMVEDAQFLLVVSRFDTPSSRTAILTQSATHGFWASHWAELDHKLPKNYYN
ncbi:hypothetical protein ABLN87_15370 [Ruegeria sp. SCPT10]|uniref:hypothetical protein n=1 Tax=Ruegeria sp. SCP10 TaxID=3141377 RepID=UPI00333CFD8C